MATMTPALRKSGICALVRLDGAPIDSADAAALGLPLGGAGPCFLADAHDASAPSAADRWQDAAGVTLFAGEIDERVDCAARLGLQPGTPPARLAAAAFARFGEETPCELLGEWSLLHWSPERTVTLMLSAARRDRLLLALHGPRLAVAPDLFALARIAWIGDALDEAGLLFGWSRGPVRAAMGELTMLRKVRQVAPGSSVTIDASGVMQVRVADVLTPQPRYSGTFADSCAETEYLLRRIMRERLARTARAAPLLSGGLDSSVIAWLAASEQAGSAAPICLTSVAPPGSGLADEAHFAETVAARLGVEDRPVWPAAELDMYRPHDAILAGASGPPLVNRHCITQAFQLAARAAGASLLINGSYGEMTVTARLQQPDALRRLRSRLGKLRPRNRRAVPPADFQVRLAPHRLAALPEAIRAAQAAPPPPDADDRRDLVGYLAGAEKALAHPNEFYAGALRMDFPFRDLRLLRLFAGMPLAMLRAGGADRGIARRLLAERLPDAVRLRRSGMPAVPDHYVRLQRQAAGARLRIPEFRRAGVDEWLDLDWLDTTLAQVAARGARGVAEANEVQLTAIGAEFLTWWRTRR